MPACMCVKVELKWVAVWGNQLNGFLRIPKIGERESVCVCVSVYLRARKRECVLVCVWERERERVSVYSWTENTKSMNFWDVLSVLLDKKMNSVQSRRDLITSIWSTHENLVENFYLSLSRHQIKGFLWKRKPTFWIKNKETWY